MNRVRDRFHDQLERSGFAQRVSDIDLLAGLGIRALRFPLLWERIAPEGLRSIDWRWSDVRLERLREVGIRPIAGLVHHGSGPISSSLLDPMFPQKVAAYAARVAQRYPWIDAYTPINEPVTTARFSCLYGLWYPHAGCDEAFVRALINQARAVVLAMRAIRRVNPSAQLIQTEDLGRVYYRGCVREEALFREHRRWIVLDLLMGRVDSRHPLYEYLLRHGAGPDELERFRELATPPSVIGVNHYLTSDRLLDPQFAVYPSSCHGRAGALRFADIEAVRACRSAPIGPRGVLREVWRRYGIPVAITESHLGCTREEQLRWIKEGWDAVVALHAEGVDVRALTVWALLGSFDWSSLVTTEAGFYEPGAFDVRAPRPRRTAIARLVQKLSADGTWNHPVLGSPGWWRRPDRTAYPTARGRSFSFQPMEPEVDMEDRGGRPILIVGRNGTLARAFAKLCDVRGLAYHIAGRDEMDVLSASSVTSMFDEVSPWAVINTAGYVRVDEAEHDRDACRALNAKAPALLAAACTRHRAKLVTFSSDLVFGGGDRDAESPYVESDRVAPLNVYGASKVEAEHRVLEIAPKALVIRTSAFFGPWDEHNFATIALRNAIARRSITAAKDAIVTPTFVPDLVHAALDLMIDGETGIWHLANGEAISWADFARAVLEAGGLDGGRVQAVPMRELGFVAQRPRYSALGSERAALMPSLEDAIARYIEMIRGTVLAGVDRDATLDDRAA